MTINKITNAPTQNGTISKINEIIDQVNGGSSGDQIFWCVPNSTTYASITSALAAEKIPVINDNNNLYIFVKLGSDNFYHFNYVEGNFVKYYWVDSQDNWTSGTFYNMTDVKINNTSVVYQGIASLFTNTAYNASSNKIATMSDIPSVGNGTITITQGGTTKGTFTANQSSNTTIDIDAGDTVDIDNSTITENSSNQLQTVAVKDNRSGNALKLWTGTKAQYDAISTKDSNTLYNIIDDQDITFTLLQTIYPVGSVYLSTNATCPLASLFGTWTLVSSGKALWTGTGSNGGSTIEAGLPNITGWFNDIGNSGMAGNLADGAFSRETVSQSGGGINGSSSRTDTNKVTFKASDSNPIYGNSTTVQPPAYVVNVWRRTA